MVTSWLIASLGPLLLGGLSGQVAYVSGVEQEDHRVTVLDVATGEVVSVGPGERDGAPRWSPDGQWLAFPTKQSEGMGICVVRADAPNRRLLQHERAWNHSPRWSPEGKRLAYTAESDMGLAQVLVVYDLDTDTEEVWGQSVDAEGIGSGLYAFQRPVWMPSLDLMRAMSPDQDLSWEGVDANALLTEAEESGVLLAIGLVPTPKGLTTEIFLVSRTQTAPLLPLLTKDSARYEEWAVEPDRKGRRIAFESNDGGDREIFYIHKRGVTDISNHRAADWNPVWERDGKWLAFESFRGGRRGVYRLFADTSRVYPVDASKDYACWAPAWSPDGDCLAYVSDQTGDPELFLYDVESGERRQLTDHPGPDLAPAWRPEVDEP